jgi:putative sigma-54 modulation protein
MIAPAEGGTLLKLSITGRHVEVPKKFTLYARKRLAKWEAFLKHDTVVHVVVTVESYRHTVEVTAQEGRYTVNAKQTTKDMYQSLDLLAEKIGSQLSRQHEKNVENKAIAPRRFKATVREVEARPASKEIVIDVEVFTGKPMTQDEAALELKSSRLPFLIFEDVETGQLAVITKRKDGTFRLVVKE